MQMSFLSNTFSWNQKSVSQQLNVFYLQQTNCRVRVCRSPPEITVDLRNPASMVWVAHQEAQFPLSDVRLSPPSAPQSRLLYLFLLFVGASFLLSGTSVIFAAGEKMSETKKGRKKHSEGLICSDRSTVLFIFSADVTFPWFVFFRVLFLLLAVCLRDVSSPLHPSFSSCRLQHNAQLPFLYPALFSLVLHYWMRSPLYKDHFLTHSWIKSLAFGAQW